MENVHMDDIRMQVSVVNETDSGIMNEGNAQTAAWITRASNLKTID